MLSDEQVNHFNREGYVVIPQVFTIDEVERLREACKEDSGLGSVLGRPTFTEALLDPRLVTPLKQLVGNEIAHFGDAVARFDDQVTDSFSRHFHNDSRNDDFDFSKEYPVVRIGIYLQDHASHSGGLKLRPGSHKKLCPERLGWRTIFRRALRKFNIRMLMNLLFVGRSLNVPSRVGDVVVWNLRTHHSGYAVRLKQAPNVSIHPKWENRIPENHHILSDRKRAVIFSTYGATSDYYEKFIKDRVGRENMTDFWKNSDFDTPKVHQLAEAAGITIRAEALSNQQ